MSQNLRYFMLFCQFWIARRPSRSDLAKPQTFPLEKPRGSSSGLRFSLVFWMSLYKDKKSYKMKVPSLYEYTPKSIQSPPRPQK